MPLTRNLPGSTVVITGASSGIGAATAVALARHRAMVVLAGRDPQALRKVARHCRVSGGEAIGVPTDVTDPAAMERLAERAVAEFGRIDAWVNNAGVATVGLFEQLPLAEFRRVVEVDLFGVAYGTRAALPRLRAAGGGVIVNNASVLAEIALPYQSAYNAAKHAIRGFSDTVRQELRITGDRNISICTLLPATIDTPFFRHSGNHSGRSLAPPPPVYPPDLVARAIVTLLRRPRRETYVGLAARLLSLQWRLAPGPTERLLGWYGDRAQFGSSSAAPVSGNLFRPVSAGVATGGWHGGQRQLRWMATALGLAATAALARGLTSTRRRTSGG